MAPSDEKRRPATRRKRGASTRAVHGDGEHTPGPMSTPIVHSSTFTFPDLAAMEAAQGAGPAGAFYQRYGHPTLRACEERLAALEGTDEALLFASGMAAISSVFLAHLRAGDHVVAMHQCYGGTHGLLEWGEEHFGWSYDLVDAREPQTWERAFRRETRILHVESPTNPTLVVVDLTRAAQLAHAHDAMLTVDNTFASPIGQHPLALGADLVMHSATKAIGGHSDLLAGVVAGPWSKLEAVWKARKVFGPVPDAEVAWRIERSLKTLALRVRAANANALEIATRLARHAGVANVFYPGLTSHPGHEVAKRQMLEGFGPVVSFEAHGGAAAATGIVNRLELVGHGPSLGSVESLASLPAFTSHVNLGEEGRRRAGIAEGMVRLSIGLEDVDDLWSDLDQAVTAAAARAEARS